MYKKEYKNERTDFFVICRRTYILNNTLKIFGDDKDLI